MCYSFSAQILTQLSRAIRNRDGEAVRILTERLKKVGIIDLYHALGMNHPKVVIYTGDDPDNPVVANWGFIRHTVDKNAVTEIWKQVWCLNTVGEEMFDKWTFKEAAKTKRCIICVDGYFESYHSKDETYPHFIYTEDMKPMTFGGLWSEWTDEQTGRKLTTFSIVTTKPTPFAARIHNNPKAPNGPRMPMIMVEGDIDDWLHIDGSTEAAKKKLLSMIKPYVEKELKAYTVGRLSGKRYLGNVPHILNKTTYPELGPEFNPHRDEGE